MQSNEVINPLLGLQEIGVKLFVSVASPTEIPTSASVQRGKIQLSILPFKQEIETTPFRMPDLFNGFLKYLKTGRVFLVTWWAVSKACLHSFVVLNCLPNFSLV